MLIRPATEADCRAIMQLVHELAVYERAPEEVTVNFEHFVQSGFGPNPVWFAFVAEVNNEVVGFTLCYIRFSTWKGQRVYLEDFYVKETHRGKGIGEKLFDNLVAYCNENKYSGLVWQVLNWNKPAINFYKKYKDIKFDGEWVNCSVEF
jgi:ribosomal protein S18 acetylase RimI-like enzyme